MLKKSGYNIEPCKTPDIISFSVLYSLPILVLCKRCDKKSFTNLSELLSKLSALSFAINKSMWKAVEGF